MSGDDSSTAGRIDAVLNFEKSIGRTLDIVHNFHTWDNPFPSEVDLDAIHRGSLLLLSWNTVDTRRVASGGEDDLIRARAQSVKALGVPIFLEWRWEMDRPNLTDIVHSPADYLAAWRHIRSIFTAEGVDNAAWVWCPTAAGFAAGRAEAYYPGDDEVDWVCVDAYTNADYTSLETLIAPFVAWAAKHPKPIMIGEFGVREGEPGQREDWLEAAARTAKSHPQIKALVYFNVDAHRNGKVYPWSLTSSPSALKTFATIGADQYFNTRSG